MQKEERKEKKNDFGFFFVHDRERIDGEDDFGNRKVWIFFERKRFERRSNERRAFH